MRPQLVDGQPALPGVHGGHLGQEPGVVAVQPGGVDQGGEILARGTIRPSPARRQGGRGRYGGRGRPPSVTSATSTPVAAQMLPISLAKLTFRARKAFEACLIISARGDRRPHQRRAGATRSRPGHRLFENRPVELGHHVDGRRGRRPRARPGRDGGNRRWRCPGAGTPDCRPAARAPRRRVVPIGSVLFTTTTWSSRHPRELASGGVDGDRVGTDAEEHDRGAASASARSSVKRSRPAAMPARQQRVEALLVDGGPPACSRASFFWSVSTPTTLAAEQREAAGHDRPHDTVADDRHTPHEGVRVP